MVEIGNNVNTVVRLNGVRISECLLLSLHRGEEEVERRLRFSERRFNMSRGRRSHTEAAARRG